MIMKYDLKISNINWINLTNELAPLTETESSFVTDTGKNGGYSYNNYYYQLCIITECDVDVMNKKDENPCNSPLTSGDEEGEVHKSAQMLYFSYSVIIQCRLLRKCDHYPELSR